MSDKFQALNITSVFPSFLQTFILVAPLSLRCSAPQPLLTSWTVRMRPIFNTPKAFSPRCTHFQELPFPFSKVGESSHHQSSTHSLMCMHIWSQVSSLHASSFTLAKFQTHPALAPLHMLFPKATGMLCLLK